MIKKLIGTLALGTLLAAGANAATISLSGPNEIDVGLGFELTVGGSGFGTGLGAGGIVVKFDPGLVQLDLVTLGALPGLDAGFSCPGGANCPDLGPGTALILWGTFGANLLPTGEDALMATLAFTAIGPGSATFTINSFDDAGGWLDPTFGSLATPDFVDAKVNVVPLPAAVWFMVGGLASLMGFRRK